MVKLDLNDWKILNQLDINSRQSDAEIGRKTRISKQVVNYRIKKLIDNKIITSFYPQINLAKLGYGAHKIYLKFKSLSIEKEKEMGSYLSNQKCVVWIISCSGRWDLIFGIASKNIEDFYKTLDNFMNKYSKFISERSISVFNHATLHHRKWLLDEDKQISWPIGGKIEERKIDKTDKEIIKILDDNARIPIVELAGKLKISASLAIQRIKKLESKGIIEAFRTDLNRDLLKINYCKSFIYYQNKTTEAEKKLLSYCHHLKNIIGVSKSVGPWDLELEFEVKNYDDFHKIMKEMKNRFPIIANFETCYIEKEKGLSFLPKNL